MSNFLIFKAAFNNSATPAVGTYTAEGATALFNQNISLSQDYYLYNTADNTAVQWFVPTAETTDFEFVADILTTTFNGYFTYFIITDSTGTTRLRMWSLNNFVYFANDDSNARTGTQYIGRLSDAYIGGFEVFHRFRVRVRKLTESSSSVEIYVDGTCKLTATAGAALVTCAKIGFMGGVNDSIPLRTRTGIQNTYLYDLSGGEVIDRGVLSGAFNRFINWAKGIFALKSDIPTVNNATLTIQRNGTTLDAFTANASVDKTININTADDTKIPLAGSNAISGSLIPATDNSIDIGSSTKNIKMLYTKGITIDGARFLPSNYIPRSGGAVLSGKEFWRTVDDDVLRFGGGTGWFKGALVNLYGKDNTDDTPSRAGAIYLRPDKGSESKAMLLSPDGTWTWSGTAVQLVSDQRLKQQISEIDDKLLDAWEDVDLVQFKYNDAVDQKKDKARLHTGYVVQQIDTACKSHGVDISAYGLYCHEEYPEETEEVEVEQADGTKTKETKVIREASEHYSLRYTEAYAIECKYLRRCIKQLTTRIEQLTARIEELEKGKEQEASK